MHSILRLGVYFAIFISTEKEEGALMHSWTEVQFNDKKVESISCIAPETNSLIDWKKTSLPIEYAPSDN